jgi:hypothetical protein
MISRRRAPAVDGSREGRFARRPEGPEQSFFDGLTADEPQLDYLRSSGIQSHEAGQRILPRAECRR